MKIVLSHGIRSKGPGDQMGALRAALLQRNVPTVLASYGYVLFPTNNRKARTALAKVSEPGDILVGYSNGGLAVLREASKLRPSAVVLLSPAARRDMPAPDCRADVFYSPGDWAVSLGKTYSAAVSLMPWRWGTPHGWGRMGADGPCVPGYNVYQWPERISHKWYKYPAIVASVADHIQAIQAEYKC